MYVKYFKIMHKMSSMASRRLGVIGSGMHDDVEIVLQLSQLFQRFLVDLWHQMRINHTVHGLNGNDAIGNRNIEIRPISDDAKNDKLKKKSN